MEPPPGDLPFHCTLDFFWGVFGTMTDAPGREKKLSVKQTICLSAAEDRRSKIAGDLFGASSVQRQRHRKENKSCLGEQLIVLSATEDRRLKIAEDFAWGVFGPARQAAYVNVLLDRRRPRQSRPQSSIFDLRSQTGKLNAFTEQLNFLSALRYVPHSSMFGVHFEAGNL